MEAYNKAFKNTPNSELQTPNSPKDHRVVITGLGIISPIGVGKEEFWENCLQGISGMRPIRGFDVSSYRSRLGAQLPEIDFKAFIKPANLRRMDRIGRIVVSTVRLALDDSGIDVRREDPNRMGILIGTGLGLSLIHI